MTVLALEKSTREIILDAVDRLMARTGFRKMSMDELALEAGVSRRTIYFYFSSKEEVGLSSIARVVDNVLEELAEILEGSSSPEEKLRQMLKQRVLGRLRAIQDYYQSLDELFEVVRPAYMAQREKAFVAECEVIATAVREGVEAGHFEVDDIATTARVLLLATNAFIPYSLPPKELGAIEVVESRLAAMIDLLVRGLRVQPTKNRRAKLPKLQIVENV
jgi:AcrR family transcriptional regulator